MVASNIVVFENVLNHIDQYVEQVLSKPFDDVSDGDRVFKGIQIVQDTLVKYKLLNTYRNSEVVYNFIRKSSEHQDEPNFIHSDREMCDTIAILYLNKEYPEGAGTIIYENNDTESIIDFGTKEYDQDNFTESIRIAMKYNRMIAFPADLYHSRAIKENFGTGKDSRLIQVLFLKHKT